MAWKSNKSRPRRRLSIEQCESRLLMAVSPVTVEAEDMAIISGGWRTKADAKASGGETITNRDKNSGELSQRVLIDEAGSYMLSVTVRAKEDDANSLYFSLDGGSRQTWHFDEASGLRTYAWPKSFSLTAGAHTLRVFGREDGTQIDKFTFTKVVTPTDPPPTPDTTPPSTPAGLLASDNGTSIQLVWQPSVDAQSGVARYNVYRDGLLIGSPVSPTFSDPNVTRGISYTYRVAAMNGVGLLSPQSSAVAYMMPSLPIPGGELDPSKPPGQNFNLSKFKLTLPVNSSGGLSGTSVEIQPAQLATYQSEWFRTAADGAMQFTTPVVGAKTSSNTSYTRSELRELNADGSLAAWTVAQGGTLTATVAINQMPVATGGDINRSRIVIGQIHGPDDELCRLYYDNTGGVGRVYYINDKSTGGNELTHDLKTAAGATSNIPLGAKFDYRIEARGGVLTVSVVHDGTTYSFAEPINSFWNGKGMYFKAGVYQGVGAPGSDAGSTGTGTGRASFYALQVVH